MQVKNPSKLSYQEALLPLIPLSIFFVKVLVWFTYANGGLWEASSGKKVSFSFSLGRGKDNYFSHGSFSG